MANQTRSIEIIIPVYNGERVLPRLLDSLKTQTVFCSCAIRCILTASTDNSEEILKERSIAYEKTLAFNHAKTREDAILSSTADIVIMLTQDVYFDDDGALEALVDSIGGKVVLAYLRQKAKGIGVERYVRHCNYPKRSETRDQTSIEKRGLDAFFCSDSCMAYATSAFRQLKGYDDRELPTNEDMYYARKVLLAGYAIHYCGNHYVNHSHRLSLKSIYRRYYLTGLFFRENPEFEAYPSTRSGLRLAWSVFWRILATLNVYALFLYFPNMFSRYLGMKGGRKGKN